MRLVSRTFDPPFKVPIGAGYELVVVAGGPASNGGVRADLELWNGDIFHADRGIVVSSARARQEFATAVETIQPSIDRGVLDSALLKLVAQLPAKLRTRPSTNGLQVVPSAGETLDPRQVERELPRINAAEQDLRVITAQAWAALKQANEPKPYLFRHGGIPVRVELDDNVRPVFRELTPDRTRHELARAGIFYVEKKDQVQTVLPPAHVAADMLATPDPPLPVVSRITEVPTFAPDGSLQTTPGYHGQSRTYYAPPPGLQIPPVPDWPSPADMAKARALWLEELFVDFPFVGDPDRAHALGGALLPVVRELIPGPTPLHATVSPVPGTGKGLLVEASLRPTCGRAIGAFPQARDDDEMRKRVTALLRDGYPAVLLDNITRPLDSGSLAMALTIPYWTDRVLGQTATVQLPVRCGWYASANNPTLSTEIARRSIRIRLDPRVDRPWERDGWKHPELLAWVDAHRGELVWALLVLVQAWVAGGRPRFSGRALGSYEQWSYVIGGILEHARIPGFLGNLQEFYEQADVETTVWRRFVEAWWEKHQDEKVGTASLFPIAEATEGFDLGKGTGERSQKTTFGKALSRQRDRVIGEYRIADAGIDHKVSMWQLMPTRPGDIGDIGVRLPTLPAQEKEKNYREPEAEMSPDVPHVPRSEFYDEVSDDGIVEVEL